MKGLLWKECYNIWSYYKWLLLLVVIFGVYSAVELNRNTFWAFYIMMLVSLIPINLLSIDEKCKWNQYCMALPVSKWKIVGSKYLIALGLLGIGFSIFFVSRISYLMIHHLPFSMEQIQPVIMGMVMVAFLPMSINFPVSYKFGVEKGRLSAFVALAVLFAVAYLIQKSWKEKIPFLTSNMEWSFVAVVIILWILSYLVSVKFFRKNS